MARMIQVLLAMMVALFALTEHGCKKKCNKVFNDAAKKLADEKNSKEQKKICQEVEKELEKCKMPKKVGDLGVKTASRGDRVFKTCSEVGIDDVVMIYLKRAQEGHFMEVLEGHQAPSPKEQHGEREVHQVPSFKEEHGEHDEKAEGEAKWENESQMIFGGEAEGQRMPGAVERHQAHLKIDG